MNILALDTATGACSAAVWRGGAVAAARFERMDRGHAEALMPIVRAVMAEAELDYPAIDRIAVTVGPGYFTGIRIGLAAARGLSLAANVPLAGFTTLAAVAHAVTDDERAGADVLAVLTSKRRELYVQRFGAGVAPLDEPRAAMPEAIAVDPLDRGTLLAGDGADLVRAALRARGYDARTAGGSGLPEAAMVARMAATSGPDMWLPATPIYLRPADATPATREHAGNA